MSPVAPPAGSPLPPEDFVPGESQPAEQETARSTARAAKPGRGRRGWRRTWRTLGQVPLLYIVMAGLCGVGTVQTAYHVGQSLYRSYTWSSEAQATEAENERLRRDIQELTDARQALSSPEYLEEVARCWGYVRQDETVLVAGNAPQQIGSNCDVYRLP